MAEQFVGEDKRSYGTGDSVQLARLDAQSLDTFAAPSSDSAVPPGARGDFESPGFVAIVAAAVLNYLRIYLVLPLRGRTRAISKDQAEEIAMQAFPDGRAIKAGFAEENGKWIWEFEVLDGTDVYRIGVDVLTASIIKTENLRSGMGSLQTVDNMVDARVA